MIDSLAIPLLLVIYILTTAGLFRKFELTAGVLAGLLLAFPKLIQEEVAAVVSGVNIIWVDPIFAGLATFIGARTLFRRQRRIYEGFPASLKLLFLLSLVGVLRGIPTFGHSAIGETRWYLFPMLFLPILWLKLNPLPTIGEKLEQLFHAASIVFVSCFVGVAVSFIWSLLSGNLVIATKYDFRFIGALGGVGVMVLFLYHYAALVTQSVDNERTKYWIITFVLGGLIVFLQIRSVWLATAAGVIALFWLAKVRVTGLLKAFILLGIVALAIAGVAMFFDQGQLFEALQEGVIFLNDPQEDVTGGWRLVGWAAEISTALESPVFGHGFGGYSEWAEPLGTITTVQVHNGYIMLFSKLGGVGLVAFFFAVFHVFRKGRKTLSLLVKPSERCVMVFLLSLFIANLVFASFYYFTIVDWLTIGAILLLDRKNVPVASHHVSQGDQPMVT